jgi:hypothetical protein
MPDAGVSIWKRKGCLSCAFCTRNKETWRLNGVRPEQSKWIHLQESISPPERSSLAAGNDEFIGAQITAAKAWDTQLEAAREASRQRLRGTILESFQQAEQLSPFRDDNKEAKKYGMPPRPDAPDRDFLACFHQQWNESRHPEIQKDRTGFLEAKRCRFYYPFHKMDGETLEACEENRKDAQDRTRFVVTTVLIVAGIIVTVFMGWLALPTPPR